MLGSSASITGKRALGAGSGFLLASSTAGLCWCFVQWQRQRRKREAYQATLTAHEQLIENGTHLVKLQVLSKLIGRNIFVKMESMNPGGTGKDRAALSMIRHAEENGLLPPPCTATLSSMEDASLDLTLTRSDEFDLNDDDDKSISPTRTLEAMILKAMRKSTSGGLVVEGTSGSTGIALATLCAARGHGCLVILPCLLYTSPSPRD